MDARTLNPLGSDALALADVIAPEMTGALTTIAEWAGIVVAALSLCLLGAVIWAVQLDFEVVAVTPGGALVPLDQLDRKNEQALRARLAANAPSGQASPDAAARPVPALNNQAAKATQSNPTPRRREKE
ncbi:MULTISPECIES: hypothetical protein [unclassified Variovorax]|uniref:hypothetical protein n=1 Tax=unclassified Variovorax TaxID=663243 RepID=UPI00076CD424|nr:MULTISPECIES: hypothetical protein [unclassified Variovorax]KWT65047.1 hypothetical protein APY03_7500 [Variovorax sp. WDL1]PNG49084.1 hypothetical protein CHC06_06321 [Variovorax sp. B2]PNG49469.1 hypothetical protein CHC07_06378 [Variovorax sp. B4]VTV18903.1 hypothetical protein WDL1P2_00519 [Variovorax sp. WDL1]